MLAKRGDSVADRFDIEELAGSGGMGAVYRARDRRTGEVVALKLLHAGTPNVDRFRREARILAELDHPGVVRCVAAGEAAGGEPWLAMEWLEGETLAARLERAELSLAESVRLGRAVAEALAAAHAHGVIHRDIKPSNLFLVEGRAERAKVLDFGVARLLGASGNLTRTGNVLGTLAYMAPEQAGSHDEVDARADLFSLGLVLHRCLAGQPAFAADHLGALLAKLVFEEAPPLCAIRPAIPAALEALVLALLAKRKEARPASAAAVARALADLGDLDEGGGERAEPIATALTAREQRLVSVIFARLDAPPAPEDTTVVRGHDDTVQISRALRRSSSELVWLADGTLVAVFEAAGVAKDLAARAARCALDLRAQHPGAALVVATGRAEMQAFSPSGEVIDRAAALLDQHAALADVLLDEVTAGLLDDHFALGLSAAGPVLLGEAAAPRADDPPSGAAHHPMPFVGRERDLAFLADHYDSCVDEQAAQAVLVTAPAGTGKSRLVAELIDRLRARGERFELWRAYGDPMSEASPLALIGALLRRAAGLLDGEPLEARRDKLRAEVARRVPEAARQRVTEFLGEILRVPFPDDDRPTLKQARQHAALMADEMRRAFEELVDFTADAGPLVIVAEDIHWADPLSLRYLDAALRRAKSRPLLVLALARPELHDLFPRLWADRSPTEIRLRELLPRAAEAMIRGALGPGVPEAVVARLVDQAGGNAFYLEQMIRAVAEGQIDTLPDTILAMVQSRLGALPPEARAALRAASIYGEVFWQRSVEALLGAGASDVGAWLDFLEGRDLVRRRDPARFPGEREYAFRHALLRDGAYTLLTEADRALGHRLAGAWLEAAGETDALILAAHYERGGDPERAVKWCLAMAEQAVERDELDAARTVARRGAQIARAHEAASAPGSMAAALASLARVEALVDERRAAIDEGAPAAALVVAESSYQFRLLADAPILIELNAGRWTRDFTQRYIDAFKQAAAPLLGRPWGKLSDLDGMVSTGPDVGELLIDFLKWSIEQGMTRVAYVISNPSARLQARRIIETSNVARMSEFFAAEDEGLVWLRRELKAG